jgi:uncharacterized membrane protein YgaE (UPF0421/DUF939 family)
MLRVIIGLIKGAVVGGLLGYSAWYLGWTGGLVAYLACALAGAVVGVIAGRAPWRAETIWTPVIKMVVGALIGAGLCFIGFRFLPDPQFHVAGVELGLHSAPVLAPAIALLYGVFVEVDDGSAGKKKAEESKQLKKKS